jgi:hypothetical protein
MSIFKGLQYEKTTDSLYIYKKFKIKSLNYKTNVDEFFTRLKKIENNIDCDLKLTNHLLNMPEYAIFDILEEYRFNNIDHFYSLLYNYFFCLIDNVENTLGNDNKYKIIDKFIYLFLKYRNEILSNDFYLYFRCNVILQLFILAGNSGHIPSHLSIYAYYPELFTENYAPYLNLESKLIYKINNNKLLLHLSVFNTLKKDMESLYYIT